MDLDGALGQFDAVDANLRRLEAVWQELCDLIPGGIAFSSGDPDSVRYQDLCRAYREVRLGLPAIDGWQITAEPSGLNEIAQRRYDAMLVDEPEYSAGVEEDIFAPGEALAEYRFEFSR